METLVECLELALHRLVECVVQVGVYVLLPVTQNIDTLSFITMSSSDIKHKTFNYHQNIKLNIRPDCTPTA